MTDEVIVSVVDDDESVAEAIQELLRAFGFYPFAFDSAESFLASDVIHTTRCVVLDVALPGISGPELFALLERRRSRIPVIFITAQGNGNDCHRLLALGAAACLRKPFEPAALIDALNDAVSRH